MNRMYRKAFAILAAVMMLGGIILPAAAETTADVFPAGAEINQYGETNLRVNMRSGPSADSEKVDTIRKGKQVLVIVNAVSPDDGSLWSLVLADETEGYIKSKYITMGDASGPAAEPAPADEPGAAEEAAGAEPEPASEPEPEPVSEPEPEPVPEPEPEPETENQAKPATTPKPRLRRSGDYEYAVPEDGTATIIRYYGAEAEIVIPDRLDGFPVTGISGEAFSGCASLAGVTIPDSVLHIDGNPFAGCGKLTQINVAWGHPCLAVMDGVLFDRTEKCLICYPGGLTAESYTIPGGILRIGDYAFYGCGLRSVTIPASVAEIGDYAFAGSFLLASAVIPVGVNSIGEKAFTACYALTKVVIPASVTAIGGGAFSSCDSLESVLIPASVTVIGDGAFRYCGAGLTVTVPGGSYAEQYCKEQGLHFQ